ncbi:MAG TPA: Rid family hydrolase [Candidatus Poseidoniaceae archaeon]|nr:Rid family hydrolase [Candidatus Poseidoniaceae archaeon]
MTEGEVVLGLFVPAHPHPLLCPEKNPGWARLREAYEQARMIIEESEAELILVYSTLWTSIIGHQFQGLKEPEWVHVDHDFHYLGSMPYKFQIDTDFADELVISAKSRGLESRVVSYYGFPIDTGSVVALSLLNPDNRLPSGICSSNMYSNRAETIVLGKSANDAIKKSGKKVAVVVVSSLSNRMFTDKIEPHQEKIHSQKDDEWNRKILEFLGEGRLEDVSQLSREIHQQIRVQKVVAFKPMWWLAGVMGQHNNFAGKVHAYESVHGAGCAVVSLIPKLDDVGDKEYDEDDVETYRGDRNVLDTIITENENEDPHIQNEDLSEENLSEGEKFSSSRAPKPVGAYPHARRVGDLLYLSGVGPRQPKSNAIPGGPVKDSTGKKLNYNMKAQTIACIENVKTILEDSGSSMEDIVDITSFLIDMDRDFEDYNTIYAEYFNEIQPTRTTLEISALPTAIAVEMKVIAKLNK